MSLSEQAQEITQAFIASQPEAIQQDIMKSFEELLGSDITDNTLITGSTAPDFTLPNATGTELTFSEQLKNGPIVLSFYRGGWCPFCNLEFAALNSILPQIKSLGASLIGISPETADASLSTAEKHQLQFEILSDSDNKIASQFGLVMTIPERMRPHYLSWGFDLPAVNGNDSFQLPVPATYIISPDGRIAAHYVNKDYTQRMEPEDIITALEALK